MNSKWTVWTSNELRSGLLQIWVTPLVALWTVKPLWCWLDYLGQLGQLQMPVGKVLFSDGTIWNRSADWLYISDAETDCVPNVISAKAANWGRAHQGECDPSPTPDRSDSILSGAVSLLLMIVFDFPDWLQLITIDTKADSTSFLFLLIHKP